MPADLSYLLRFDDEVLPLSGSSTIGRHLDADAVVAGEDVLDFHLRIEIEDRGPVAHPLADATFSVNGKEWNRSVGLAVGDAVGVGSVTIQIGVERERASEAEEWWLYEAFGDDITRIKDALTIGRQADCDIVVSSDHVSRRHAQLRLIADAVWVVDLDSANGTRINDEAVVGSRRLLHGDLVRFDETAFQLVGRGGELTGVRRPQLGDIQPMAEADADFDLASETIEREAPTAQRTIEGTSHGLRQPGSYLVGLTEPVAGQNFRLPVGRSVIGADQRAQLRVVHSSLAARHAEIALRAEGAAITNLVAGKATLVNEEPVRVAYLSDGDVVTCGQVQFCFERVLPAGRAAGGNGWRLGLIAAGSIAAIAAATALLLA